MKNIIEKIVSAVTPEAEPQKKQSRIRFDAEGNMQLPDPVLPANYDQSAPQSSPGEPPAKITAPARLPWCEREWLARKAVRSQYDEMVAAQKEYHGVYDQWGVFLDARQQLRRLARVIESETNLQVVEAARREYAELSGPAADMARNRARNVIGQAADKFRQVVLQAIAVGEAEAREILAGAIKAETDFLAQYELPFEPTELSISIRKRLLNPLARMRSAIDHDSRHPSGPLCTRYNHMNVFQFFRPKE